MKKIIIAVLLLLAFAGTGDAHDIAGLVLFIWVCAWGVKKLMRSGRKSAPTRMSEAAGQAFYSGMMNWLNREPTQAEIERERERAQAKKDYAFHSYQAERYKGTRSGAWHEDMARRARNKMR